MALQGAIAMIVFVAGMPRSGSTFGFNVARELLIRRGTVHQEQSASLLDTIDRSGGADHVLCHGHAADKATLRLVGLGVVKVVCTVRRPEDAIASEMECFGDTLDTCLEHVGNWFTMFERLRDRSLIVCYEQIDSRPRHAALRIAQHICPDYSPEELDQIARKYVKENVMRMTHTLRVDENRLYDLGHTYYNQQTFFHRRHVSALVSRPASERIGADAVSYVREAFAPYIDERGDLLAVYGELQQEIR